jgi:tripartite-type tricarboxylate transporter receptor subunit TctC
MRHAGVRSIILLSLSILLNPTMSAKAQSFPDHEIEFVVAFPAGGPVDVVARATARALSSRIGQAVRVTNLVGGSGIFGVTKVLEAQPDGYTLLFADLRSMVLIPGTYKLAPYDALQDFTAVALVSKSSFTLVAPKSLPYSTLKEVIAAAKATPGKLTIGNGGSAASSQQIVGAAFQARTGIKLNEIGAKLTSGPPADLQFEPTNNVISEIAGPRMKAIAVSAANRDARMPQVPTMAESGVPELTFDYWFGIFGPKRMPPAAVSRIQTEIAAAGPAIKAPLEKNGYDLMDVPAEKLPEFMKEEYAKWNKVIHDANIRVD